MSGTTNSQFYNLTVNKGAGSLTINSPQTVTNNLTVAVGTLTISSTVSIPASGTVILTTGSLINNANQLTLANGASITRAGGLITTSSPSGGPWNLTYTGASKTTSFEIPASGNLASLTINTNSGTAISLPASQPVNVTGPLTTNSGTTFNSGSNNVTVGSLSNTGTFNAPSIAATVGLTLNGLLTNNGTFNAGSGTVVIGGTVSISGTIPTLNNLTVNSSGIFNSPNSLIIQGNTTINSGGIFNAPNTLTVQGNLQNSGSFVAGTGTITFSGNTAKTITGTTKTVFNNLVVNNGTAATDLGLETASGADLKGVLTIGASAIFDTDGAANDKVFTLLSAFDTPTADASIAALPGAGQLPGKITVQRYMGRSGVAVNNYQVWRDISSPVNSTVSDLQNSLPVTGTFTGASTVPGASGASMFGYDETVITDTNGDAVNDINDGWFDFPADNGNSSTTFFTQGKGYQMFIFGSDAPVVTNGNAKWSLRGPIWNGTFNLPVTLTNSGPGSTYSAANDGWNLVGNPYPSTIDWGAGGWTKTNLDDAIYIDDYNHDQPVFASYVNGVGTNGGSRYIAMGQGFWVKANALSPVLTISENVKASGTQTTLFRKAYPDNLLRITLASTT
ncbi:MAG: hypothetical protein HY015_03125, partial [Bacteroidetes bacterium]|nr:hypothetical protein [Bacteroidota bacterium]